MNTSDEEYDVRVRKCGKVRRTGQEHADALALVVAAELAARARHAVDLAAAGLRARARVLARRAPGAPQEELLQRTKMQPLRPLPA